MNKNFKNTLVIIGVVVLAGGLFFGASKLLEMGGSPDVTAPRIEAGSTSANSSAAATESTSPGSVANPNSGSEGSASTTPSTEDSAALFASLTFVDQEGKTRTLSEFKGQYLIVNYWASWCPPCKEEMPDLQKFYDKYKDDPTVEFVSIDAVGGRETKEEADKYIAENGFTFPYNYDDFMDVGGKLGLSALPSSFSVGPDSQPGFIMEGQRELADFEQLLEETKKLYP